MTGASATSLHAATFNQDIAVMILAAKGEAFSSGHNSKEMTEHRADADQEAPCFKPLVAQCCCLMMQINHHRCPMIAEVNGAAVAAGCQLVATCDLAYASPDATFCTPGVKIGLFCSTPMVPLSRNLPAKHASEMLLTGDVKDAAFSQKVGLINALVPKSVLTQYVNTIVNPIATKSQIAI